MVQKTEWLKKKIRGNLNSSDLVELIVESTIMAKKNAKNYGKTARRAFALKQNHGTPAIPQSKKGKADFYKFMNKGKK